MRRKSRLKEIVLPETSTILIAVADGVLADSLRFALELEGFDAKFCIARTSIGADDGAPCFLP